MGQSSTAGDAAGAAAGNAEDADSAAEPAPPQPSPPSRRWYRLALLATVLVVLFVALALPLALRSMADELFGRQDDALYDVLTGSVVTSGAAAEAAPHMTYVNLTVTAIDEGTGVATLSVSGHRVCPAACPTLTILLLSLNDDAAMRRGLPPSATVTLGPTDLVFTQTQQLPVRGHPSFYPFDDYRLWLGVAGFVTDAAGATVPITAESVTGHAVVTLQSQVAEFLMAPPVRIDPERVRAPADILAPLAVLGLTFERPRYLEVLSVLLVLLIAVSGTMALFTRDIGDLLLGIGSLILGVWGVRSVLVPQPLPSVSAVDLALSGVILLLLVGLAVRVAHHFHRRSDLRLPRPRRRP